jgi:hypothetical protein
MRRALPWVLAGAVLGAWGCRQLAGIDDIELVVAKDAATRDAPFDAGSFDAPDDRGGDRTDSAPPEDAAKDSGCVPSEAGMCGCPCCAILASDLDTPLSLVRVGGDIYVLNYGSAAHEGSLVHYSIADGGVETLFSSLDSPLSLVTDSTHLYWEDQTGPGGMIEKYDLAGGPDGGYTAIASGQGTFSRTDLTYFPTSTLLALTSTHLYWVTYSGGLSDGVNTVKLTGGTVTTFASTFPVGVKHGGEPFGPTAIQTDGTSLYVITEDSVALTYGVIRLSLADGAVGEAIATGLPDALNLALAGSEVLIAGQPSYNVCTNGSIQGVSEDGGALRDLASALPSPWSITIDDGGVAYGVNNGGTSCTTGGSGSITRLAVDGGSFATVGSTSAPQAAVTDSDFVYWIDSNCGSLLRVPK